MITCFKSRSNRLSEWLTIAVLLMLFIGSIGVRMLKANAIDRIAIQQGITKLRMTRFAGLVPEVDFTGNSYWELSSRDVLYFICGNWTAIYSLRKATYEWLNDRSAFPLGRRQCIQMPLRVENIKSILLDEASTNNFSIDGRRRPSIGSEHGSDELLSGFWLRRNTYGNGKDSVNTVLYFVRKATAHFVEGLGTGVGHRVDISKRFFLLLPPVPFREPKYPAWLSCNLAEQRSGPASEQIFASKIVCCHG